MYRVDLGKKLLDKEYNSMKKMNYIIIIIIIVLIIIILFSWVKSRPLRSLTIFCSSGRLNMQLRLLRPIVVWLRCIIIGMT